MGDGIAASGTTGLSGVSARRRGAGPGSGAAAYGQSAAYGQAASDGQPAAWAVPDSRRVLQLALGGLWLLDAVLQYQSAMFSRAFPQMLAGAAQGNPAVIADPIAWSAGLIDHHVVAMNTVFATVQLLLGLGIAWRPTVRLALGASVLWALAVWWLGEGLGMVLTGTASPVNGAPGAVILYALLAVLLWPADRDRPAPFVAGRAIGARAARLLWLVLWGSLAYLALQPDVRAPQALSRLVAGMASGQPGWLAATDRGLGGLLSGQGLAASVGLAVVLAAIAAGIYLPRSAVRAVLVLAVAVAAAIWAAEGLGGLFGGMGTDPDSGPLLALLALAYWPSSAAAYRPSYAAARGADGPGAVPAGGV
jgi:hypothetical protein